jgi:acyl transferase domain-containing protein
MSDDAQAPDRRTLLRDALRAVDEMQARLDAAERRRNEPIAIVGLGCRFPGGASSPDDYWRLLRDGVDAVSEVPPERWGEGDARRFASPGTNAPPTFHGGFLDGIDRFDPHVFGLSPREAASMDPQQRLVLEVTWEALEWAGIAPDRLAGTATGVFVGVTTTDYAEVMRAADPTNLDVYFATGNAHNVVAGRLSYLLGLRGPSLAVDTACSSSLTAVHLACQSLRLGESDLTLAAGVNALLVPDPFVVFGRWGMMAPDGRCKTFDAHADGFVRAEGCGVLVLKRLGDALAAGDRVLAVIRGSAVNQDGASSGLTVPNGLAQQAVIRQALAAAGVAPADIDYVEAHGTGTSLGDPIELEALDAVLSEGRATDRPLVVGSVKTNLGHCESASGVAGLIKVVLALEHEAIPPHLHFETLTPKVVLRQPPVVPTRLLPWRRGARTRLAGVSSFGFSGTNAHVVLEEAPVSAPLEPARRPAAVVAVSARTPAAARELAGRYARHLQADPQTRLPDVSLTTTLGRAQFAHRIAVAADTVEAAERALSAAATGASAPGVLTGHVSSGSRPAVAFLFPGQGAQWPGMARELAAGEPVVRQALASCASTLRDVLDVPLLEVLEREDLLNETQYTQPALFAVEWALAALWRSWGVEPVAVLGHSVGEYAAACVAGVMDVDDALRLIAARGRLMQERTMRGTMAAVFADEATVARAVDRHARAVAIAAVNAPDSVVVSGAADALTTVLDELSARGIRARRLTVSHAFHSPLMDAMLDEFAQVAATVTFRAPRLPLVSNVTGAVAGADVATPDYWVRHVRRPVQFAAGLQALLARRPGVLLEVGPGTTLLGLAGRGGEAGTFEMVPTLRAGHREPAGIAEAVGRLWTTGVGIDWHRYHESSGSRRIGLPTYPFQRERHWVARGPGRRTAATLPRDAHDHPLLGHRLVDAQASGVSVWEGAIDLASFPYLSDHRVQGRVIVPATAYLEMAIAAGAEVFGPRPLTLSRIKLHAPLALDPDTLARTQTVLTGSAGGDVGFAVQSRAVGAAGEASAWTLHATGRLAAGDAGDEPTLDVDEIRARCPEEVSGEEFYRRLAARGNDWGPCFRGLARVWRGREEAVAEVRAPGALATGLDRYRFHPALADAAGHALAATIPLERSEGRLGGAFVGGALDRFVFRRPPRGRLFTHARRRDAGGADNVLAGDVRLVDETGAVVAEVQGARLWYLDAGAAATSEATLARRLYAVEWRRASMPTATPPSPGRWLILADADGVGAAVAAWLSAAGAACVLVHPGERYERLPPDRIVVRPDAREDVRRLVTEMVGAGGCAGVVHLWSLDSKVGPDATGADVEAAQRGGCASLLVLVQELAAARRPGRLPLWLVTRGAQPAGGVGAPEALPAAALWGMGRTLAVEHADLWGGLVDLDPGAPAENAAAMLGAHVLAADGEDQVAFRGGERCAARLVRTSPGDADRSGRWRPDASYLVTGGLGGLGLQVARWMVEQGARRIVLVGRSGLPARREWSRVDPASRDGRRIAAVRSLEALGASVHLAAVDVADERGLREFLDAFRGEGWPPIRGVVHAAGTVLYGPLAQTSASQLAEVLRPKVVGAWLLHRLLAADPLDFFVLFSSASGVLSSPLVGAYAAANACLDALAHRRVSEGRPALSIDWGLWAGAGMAEQVDAEGLAALTARGMGSLAPEQALEALGAFLDSTRAQVGVIPVNWPVWRERYPMFTAAPFLAEILGGEPGPAGAAPAVDAGADLLALEPAARAGTVLARLRGHMSAVLRVDPETIDAEEPLTSFGIDSLMAVELKNRVDRDLGLSVPLVHYLDGSGIGRLTQVLLESVGAPAPAGVAEAELLARLPEMSDAEVDTLLKQMLAEQEGS